MEQGQPGVVNTGFGAFDELTGGLHRGEAYLIYGAVNLGKSALALGFVSEGLVAGETAALVTSQSPAMLLEQARACGLDFDASFRSNRLVLFEYPEDIAGNSSRLLDDLRIVEEFRGALAGCPVQRVVFDPITPLLAGPSQTLAADRFRTIADSIRAMGATALYLIDLPEGKAQATAVKGAAHGVIRFEQTGEGSQIVLESMPQCASGESIRYELEAGLGLRAMPANPRPVLAMGAVRPVRSAPAAMPSRPPQSAGRLATILLIDPDDNQWNEIQALLNPEFRVLPAAGAADGLSAVATVGPDLVILSEEVRGASGVDIARKLRSTGRNLPILLISRRLRRVSDQAALLHVGIDACLRLPAERSLVRPSVWNLLRRSGAIDPLDRGSKEYNGEALASDVNCTGDLDYFVARLLNDAAFCQQFGAMPNLLVMRIGRHLLDELSSVVALFTRSMDLVYTGDRGIAVLLAGAGDAGPFLERFRRNWKGGTPPFVDAVGMGEPVAEASLRLLVVEAVGVRRFEAEKKRAISSTY